MPTSGGSRVVRSAKAATTHAGRAAIERQRRKGLEPRTADAVRTTATPPRSRTARFTKVGRGVKYEAELHTGPRRILRRKAGRSVSGRRDRRRVRGFLGLLRRPLLLQALPGLLRVVFLRRLVGHDGPSHDLGCAHGLTTVLHETGHPDGAGNPERKWSTDHAAHPTP